MNDCASLMVTSSSNTTTFNTAHNNQFPFDIINTLTKEKQETDSKLKIQQKWISFTYVDKETYRITKMIKELNITIANITNKNISKIVSVNNQQHENPNLSTAVSA
jgi:hypothetical protein